MSDNTTLGHAIFTDLEKNEYLNEIYNSILYNYAIKLLGLADNQWLSRRKLSAYSSAMRILRLRRLRPTNEYDWDDSKIIQSSIKLRRYFDDHV